MLRLLNQVVRRFGVEIRRSGSGSDPRADSVVTLPAAGKAIGNVLVSYIIDPFLQSGPDSVSNSHTHFWESVQIATAFRDLGYTVDVISHRNRTFEPKRDYRLFVSARTNLEVIGERLNADCIQVAHLDTAHWLFNNQAACARLLDLQRRRGVTLGNRRTVEENWAIERAQMGTVLGNQFTMDTYAYAAKPLRRIPISVPATYPWPADKDFERCRRNFIWFGSEGFVHKGLDRVLEAFARMPECHLTVFGPLHLEQRFVEAFHRELYDTPNIRTYGWIDVESEEFRAIAGQSLGVVYPSCSEGGGGSVITCMHAGLIPVVTWETSVDVADAGILLPDASIEQIATAIRSLAEREPGELRQMARAAWELAREQHTRERFALEFSTFAREVLEHA